MGATGTREQAKLVEEADKGKGSLWTAGSGIVCTL